MPTILTEKTKSGKLTFEFSDKWQVCKYDEQKFYTQIKNKGLKAVDFLAISKKSILLIEVKYVIALDKKSFIRFSEDSDKERIEKVEKKLSEECQFSKTEQTFIKITSPRPYLVDEVAKKVQDTLLGLFASYRNNDEELLPYSQSVLMSRTKPIFILLFLERNEQLNQEKFFKQQASNLQLAIAQKLSFLGNVQVAVVNSLTLPANLDIKILENEAKT